MTLNQRLTDLLDKAEVLAATTFCGQEPLYREFVEDLRGLKKAALSIPGCSTEPKARGSIDDISAYCREVGLTEMDGGWFFDKCEGCGWVNGRNKIADWRATVRAWKAIGVFPSQKQGPAPRNGYNSQPAVTNNAPIDRMIALKEFERVEARIKNLRDGRGVYETMNPKDLAELKSLRQRQKELKHQLGIQV